MPISASAEPGAALHAGGLLVGFPGVGVIVDAAVLDVRPGEQVALEGPSGAGKTSLLHALAGIERPSAGNVSWDGVALWDLPMAARDRWRRERLGLVFQDMHLLDGLTALDNVLLPVAFDHARAPAALRLRAAALLDGLGVVAGRRAAVLSRGERQRVAIARALLRQPAVLMADEPTASLDRAAAAGVADVLTGTEGATLITATHDPALLERLPGRLRLVGGRLERVR